MKSKMFMIEDVMFLLYATLAGMAMWFPMLFRMKFRFTNQQLLCTQGACADSGGDALDRAENDVVCTKRCYTSNSI